MHQTPYDSIGINYNHTRMADCRVTSTIQNLLDLSPGSIIGDIGAGTGNYSLALANMGYKIIAVEPSEQMRKQSLQHENITWVDGYAESMPLPNKSVNGCIIILALHHFAFILKAIQELTRICPDGPIVVFTMDPRDGEEFWFYRYFPDIHKHVLRTFPPLAEIINLIALHSSWSHSIIKFPLPADLVDRNMCSGWNKPEVYLDPKMRQNASGFALASPEAVQKDLKRLQRDLKIGEWDERFGFLRKRDSFDAGFRFIKFQNK